MAPVSNSTFNCNLSFCETILLLLFPNNPAAILPTVGQGWIFNEKSAGSDDVFLNGEPLVALLDLRPLPEPLHVGLVAVEGALQHQLLRDRAAVGLGQELGEMVIWGSFYKWKPVGTTHACQVMVYLRVRYSCGSVVGNPISKISKKDFVRF